MKTVIKTFRLPLLPAIAIVLIALISLVLIRQQLMVEPALSPSLFGKIAIIDPGHGDWDPGVVGINGIKEKDINLAIAKNLAEMLRNSGATVLMTRENDTIKATSKSEDTKARAALAEGADVFISIHANSFPAAPNSHGAQIFYGTDNLQGKKLAELIQKQTGQHLNSTRTALSHKNAYLLKNITIPAVIAEMGFLSNREEAQKLTTIDYQWQAAWAVYLGIVDYFSAPLK
ncbi:MAG: N-acetylmuramoyl-L-alanine amidase [Clostridiales bacterium]